MNNLTASNVYNKVDIITMLAAKQYTITSAMNITMNNLTTANIYKKTDITNLLATK